VSVVAVILGGAACAAALASASFALSTRTDEGGPLLTELTRGQRRDLLGLSLVLAILGVGLVAVGARL
jgi:hypothetical protein